VAAAFFAHAGTVAQTIPAEQEARLHNPYTDISKTGLVKPITKTVSSAYTGLTTNLAAGYAQLDFITGTRHTGNIPSDHVTKKLILRFNLCNTADTTVSAWFFPGYYYTDIQLYKSDAAGLTVIPSVLPDIADHAGYRQLSVPPHDSVTFVAELRFLKTYINSIRPRLVQFDYAERYMRELRSQENDRNLATWLFCGLLLMMVLFSLTNFLQRGNPEFLYYSAYAFFLGSMLFTKALYAYRYSPASFLFEAYLDFILQALGIMFYMLFMQRFLDTKNKHPFLYKLYTAGIALLGLSLLSYSLLHYFSNNYSLENLVENLTKLLLLVMIVIFLVYSFRKWQDKLLRYLFWGNLCLLIFSMISQAAVMQLGVLEKLPGVFSSSVFYYELGLFLELLFFMAGLNYKNRSQIIAQTKERESLKAQNQLQEYEKEIAVYKAQQEERQRISADMHDELGSGMTAIRLMSEIARNKMKENTPVELDKISASADDVLNKMNAIIWSMNSGNDTLDNLISYIRSWSQEYLENTPVGCKVITPVIIRDKVLTGDKRRNIFLCVKESLNNVLKHSKASMVTITIEAHENLRIEIADNGPGIDLQKLRAFGNGLKNIARRMESIHGSFNIENRNGTVTTLELPL
jgi:signal transduction histidine kinase